MIPDDRQASTQRSFAYDPRVKTITRIATRVDAVLTRVIGALLRGLMAVLTLALGRGKHREWRRRDAEAARRRSEATRP
jgi:hypothetical protein